MESTERYSLESREGSDTMAMISLLISLIPSFVGQKIALYQVRAIAKVSMQIGINLGDECLYGSSSRKHYLAEAG